MEDYPDSLQHVGLLDSRSKGELSIEHSQDQQ